MKERPYIGITGFKDKQTIDTASDIFRYNTLYRSTRTPFVPMYGFLVSNHRMSKPDTSGHRSPAFNDLPGLLCHVPKWGLPMLHYFSENKDSLEKEVRQLMDNGGTYERNLSRALQLNMDWPRLDGLEKIMKRYEDLKIVLQLPHRATENHTVQELSNVAKPYDSLVSYVLIDPSGGKGKLFDLEEGLELMHMLKESMPTTRVGIAGGFDGDNVTKRIIHLKSYFHELFSIDAEGRLMKRGNLIDEKMGEYVSNAHHAFSL